MDYVQVHSATLDAILQKLDSLELQVEALSMRIGDPLLSVKQAAQMLGCHPKTIQRKIASGELVPIDCNGRPKFSVDEINRYKKR